MKENFKLEDNKTFLYTKGGEYALNLREYVGEYHFQGNDPYTGPVMSVESKKLAKFNNSIDVMIYDSLAASDITNIKLFEEPVDSFVEPTDNNYNDGYFIRYFIKRYNDENSVIYEINSDEVSKFGKPGGIDSGLYQLTELVWAISKDEKNTNRIIRENTKNVLISNKQMPGIIDNILNYFEFSFIVI